MAAEAETLDDFWLGKFGDERLDRVGRDLLTEMINKRTVHVRRLGGCRSQEVRFGRFLHNENVTMEAMLAEAAEQVGLRASGRDVLVIQDTTEINYAHHAKRKRGFGKVGNGEDIGLFLHPLLVLEASTGGILGLAGCQILNRRRRVQLPAIKRPLSKKESRRWLAGAQQAGLALEAAASVTVVADRESDIYEEFACRPDNVHLLTRAAQDRLLADGRHLFEAARSYAEAARYMIDVPAKGKRKARQTMVSLRYGEVTLCRPRRCLNAKVQENVRLAVVHVEEIAPPRGEKAVAWTLLTTHEVNCIADAQRMVAWYRRRWTIEELNRTLKSQGLDVEESQIVKATVVKKLCVIALLAATQVIQLVCARDGHTRQKLTDGFEMEDQALLEKLNVEMEGKTEKQKNPHNRTTLAWAAWIIGRLGGWNGYYKKPGPKVMHIGLARFHATKQGWLLAQSSINV
jgi:hypothetical protein